jgi:hypothetical protein
MTSPLPGSGENGTFPTARQGRVWKRHPEGRSGPLRGQSPRELSGPARPGLPDLAVGNVIISFSYFSFKSHFPTHLIVSGGWEYPGPPPWQCEEGGPENSHSIMWSGGNMACGERMEKTFLWAEQDHPSAFGFVMVLTCPRDVFSRPALAWQWGKYHSRWSWVLHQE